MFVCVHVQESDLHSAVCLEQAAHAFLRIVPPMGRKYALHLILAGHRYAKSAQVSIMNLVCLIVRSVFPMIHCGLDLTQS